MKNTQARIMPELKRISCDNDNVERRGLPDRGGLRGENSGAWRVARFALVAVMAVVFGLAGFVASAEAAVAIDNVTSNAANECSSGDCSATHNSITFSHTVSGSDRLLLVVAQGEGDQANPDVSSITYAGQGLTSQLVAGPTRGVYVQIWSLLNPPTGTANVVVTYGGTTDNSGATAVSLTGVDQTTPLGASNFVLSTGSGTASSMTLTTTYADSYIVAAHTGDGGDTDPYTPNNITEQWDYASGTQGFSDTGYAGGYVSTTTAQGYTFGWNQSASDDWAIAGIEVVPNQCTPGTMTAPSGDAVSGNPLDICGTIALTGGASVTNVTITEGGGVPDVDPNGTYIEAENYTQIVNNPGATPALATASATAGANGGSYVETTSGAGSNDPAGQRADYPVNFTTGGTYYFWVRLHDVGGGNSIFVGIDGVIPEVGALTQTANGAWYWTNNVQTGTGGNSTSITAGPHTINIWGRENTLTDGIYITTVAGTPPGLGGSAGQYTGTIPTGATVIDPSNTLTTLWGPGTCSGIDTTGWTGGTKDVAVVADDGCGGTLNDSGTITFSADVTPPSAGTVTVSPDSGTEVPAAFTITTTFTDAESAVTSCDYTLNGGGAWSAGTVSGSGPYTCTANVTGQSDGASLTINMRATSGGGTTTSTQISRTVDAVSPTTSISVTGSTSGTPVPFTVTFSEPVTGFAAGDVTLGGTAGATTPVVSGGPSVYTVNVSGMTGDGTITMDIAADVAFDDVNNGNTAATQASTTWTSCVESGTVTVSISPDPGAGDITGDTTVTANLGGGATNGMVRWRVNGGPWSLWAASGSTFTPPAKDFGSVEFEAMADGSCGAGSPVYSTSITRNFDTRVDALEPQSIQEALQNGLTSIRVFFDYCNDKNNTGTFLVEYKLASSGTWLNAANMPTTDGGAGDNDGTLNEEIEVIITGLDSSELYDIRITYIDSVDGVIGTDIYNLQVQMVAWTDDPLLHNALRFACDLAGYWDQTSCEGAGGTWTIDRKWATGWGTDTGEYGPITCDTCHTGSATNVKRISSTVTASSGSFPGSAVVLSTVEDGTSEFGDDTGGHATSDKVCEVCHSQTDYHRYDTSGQAGGTAHYNQADCIKCHEHKIGFRASCNACHGNPPTQAGELVVDLNPVNDTGSTTWGEHDVHVNTVGYTDCNTCHNDWQLNGEMPKSGEINIGFVTPGTDGGTYNGRIGGGGYNPDVNTTVNATGAMTCTNYCHGYGTPQWNPTASANCGACHGEVGSFGDDRAGAPTGGTSLDLSGAASGFKVGKHANHLDDSIAETGDPCALCHDGFAYADATHVDGTVNVNLHAAAGVTASFSAGSPGTCSNLDCHDNATWDSNASGGCTFCHGYPPTSASSHAAGVNPVNHDMYSATGVRDNHDDCTYCHGYKNNGSNVLLPLTAAQITNLKGDPTIQPSLAGYHQDGKVTINANNTPTTGDNASYNTTNGGCDNAACHANDASHRFTPANTGNYQPADIGPGACTTCHDTGVGGAPVVNVSSSHVLVTTGGTFGDCTDCHSGHYTSGDGVQIPNNATVGISYTTSGHGGIMLGGSGTAENINGVASADLPTQTSEAEICWTCHDAQTTKITEWLTNTDTNGAEANYDFGQVYTSAAKTTPTASWIGTYWVSANFAYKEGFLNNKPTTADMVNGTANAGSTHAASSAGVSGVDSVANIRCSYCHDVHELNQATGDSTSGKPYLRGNWMGNPYLEDGAPRSGDSWTGTNVFGAVPRGTNAARGSGFQIDQNNGNPTSGWTAAGSAGLCELCHGNGDGTFSAAEIDGLNQFGTASTDWVGTNGHSASVLGGGDSVATNIFSINDRNVSPPTFIDNNADNNSSESNPAMAYQQVSTGNTGNRAFGFRSASSEPDGWNLAPRTTSDRAHDSYNWGANTQNGLDSNYHNFSCSKCHNPHASRLPRLMITNCLDTKVNTWDDGAGIDVIPAEGTTNNDGAGSINAENADVTFSNTTSAQNCHRVKDPAFSNSRGSGWNNVTPW